MTKVASPAGMCRIIAWGSYDDSKPRIRLLIGELRARHLLGEEISIPIWSGIRDKAVAGPARLLKAMVHLLASYPGAIIKLWRQPTGSILLLPYPAIPDIFVAWPIARLRRHTIVFDAFISMHDTMVSDRHMVPAGGLVSRLLWMIEKAALSLADIILVDTDQHGTFFAAEFSIEPERFHTILVGAEPAFWEARQGVARGHPLVPSDQPVVLFYGQLIPLHGLETICDAISRTQDERFRWLIIGSGQEEPKLRSFLEVHGNLNVSWVPWVEYEQLPAIIASASIGLGIFGCSSKAARVIPNKLFQMLAVGKRVITRSSPAVDPIAARYPEAIVTVPAGDGAALAAAVRAILAGSLELGPLSCPEQEEFGPGQGAMELAARLHLDDAR